MSLWCLTIISVLTIVGHVKCWKHHKHLAREQRLKQNVESLLVALERRGDEDPKYYNEDEGSRWMAETNEELRQWDSLRSLASWSFTTNITNETMNTLLLVDKEYSEWYLERRAEALKFKSRHFGPDLQRQFSLFALTSDAKEPNVREKLNRLNADMETLYNTATVCGLPGHSDCLPLEPELDDLMAQSRDPAVLKAAWKGWRDAAGRPMRDMYRQFVDALNIGAVQNGYRDYGEAWRQDLFYDTQDLQRIVEALWRELRPLYLHLHAYVRRRLRETYGEPVMGNDGTIPAHVLGNMWSQNWMEIYPLVTPFPEASADKSHVDATLKTKYDQVGLFRLAEAFYASMGLYNMTEKFWRYSMILRPADRKVQCHASAFDMFSLDDFRIKMCTEVSENYMETVHHEMGHVEYYMAYQHQPAVYRDGANCAFHEAIGDTISLSVMSSTHMKLLGLDSGSPGDKYKESINDLLKAALNKIGFLPFGLLVDRWRWQVFSQQTTSSNYNRDWWQLRLDLQGIKAPVPRSEDDFDPGAKFHVPSNSPYICYFVSFVAQFQFYKSLCEASGHTGPLHQCDFYGSKQAGDKFKHMLELGASLPWQDAMKVLTGTRQISASALLEYFRPLRDWLEKDNALHNENPGWEGATINWRRH